MFDAEKVGHGMEQVNSIKLEHYQDDDFDELTIQFRNTASNPTYAVVADDENNVFLNKDAETDQVVGATIVYARDWFQKLSQAFGEMNLDDQDVRFFLVQKLRALAEQEDASVQSDSVTIAKSR